MPIPILFVLLPNTLMLDIAGPAEVLRLASPLLPDDGFALQYVGPCAVVQTSIGLPLAGITPLPGMLPERTLVVLVGTTTSIDRHAPGEADAACNAVVQWLQTVVATAGNPVMCVCSGALLAARAGLLNGRLCTTHYTLCEQLQRLAPRARVQDNRLYVSDGLISTSAGISAGIDLMLHWLSQTAGPQIACSVARDMVVYARRSGHDAQLSPWLSGRNHLHPGLHRVQDAVAAAPGDDWSSKRMAQLACTSERHLARLFQEHVQVSPVHYVHRLRVALAKELIGQSTLDMESIAQRSGFGSARHMRRIWRKFEAQPPSGSRSA